MKNDSLCEIKLKKSGLALRLFLEKRENYTFNDAFPSVVLKNDSVNRVERDSHLLDAKYLFIC